MEPGRRASATSVPRDGGPGEAPRRDPGASGEPAGLGHRDPADRLALGTKQDAKAHVERLIDELDDLHDRLWAEARRSVLLVLQGMDAGQGRRHPPRAHRPQPPGMLGRELQGAHLR